jgi:hypothetical protein
MAYVYLLFRPDGRPLYVGKGKDNRWLAHERKGHKEHHPHRNKHLRNVIALAKDMGKELPKVKLIDNVSDAEAIALEKLFIAAIGRELNGGPLLNLTDGGDGPEGYKPSQELIDRQVAIRKGWHHTDEHKAKVSAMFKGKPKTPEHNAKVSASNKGKKRTNGWWSTPEGRAAHGARIKAIREANGTYGHTDETKAKIREKRLNQKNVNGFKKGVKPSEEFSVKHQAGIDRLWAKRRLLTEQSCSKLEGTT